MNEQRFDGRNSNEGQPLLRAGETMVGPTDMRGFTLARVYRSSEVDATPEAYLLLVNSEVHSNPDGTTYMRAVHAGNMQKNAIPLSLLDLDAFIPMLVRAKAQLLKDQAAYHGQRRLAEDQVQCTEHPRTEPGQARDIVVSQKLLEEGTDHEAMATRSVAEVVAEAINKSFKDFDW